MSKYVGVVLAGGTGSRLLPLTRAINKHLLPVRGFPMLHWSLLALSDAGASLAIVVLGGKSCGQVVEHFGSRYDVGGRVISIAYVYQNEAKGIPDAILASLDVVEKIDKFGKVIVVLGDNIFDRGILPAVSASRRAKAGTAVVFSKLMNSYTDYGCIAVDDNNGNTILEEKPTYRPSDRRVYGNWRVITGLYIFPVRGLRDRIALLNESDRGELEVIGLLRQFNDERKLIAVNYDHEWTDAGTMKTYTVANSGGFVS